MQTLLSWLLIPFKWIAGLLLPIFARPRIPAWLFWVLHILLLLLIFGGLFYLHHGSEQTSKSLELWMPEVGSTWLRQNYLLVLAGLIYVFAWLAVWLWKIWLEADLDDGAFPDIDDAWNEIQQALRQSGIRLDDAPLFLVIGRAELPLERLFKGMPRECVLTGITSGASPLRMFGGRDALYLACPGVSLVSKALGHGPADAGTATSTGAGAEAIGTKTIGAEYDLTKSIGADAEEFAKILRTVQREGRSVSEEERLHMRHLTMNEDKAGTAQLRPNVVQNPETVSLQEARMHYFCKLLAKERKPFTPLNGVALLMSLDAAENEGTAQKIALSAQKDLATLQESLKLQFPVFVLLADLEKWAGASAFMARFPEDRRKNRLGRGFPLAPDLSVNQFSERVEKEVEWIFARLLPFWCFRFFRLAKPNEESHDEAVQANGELFRFLAESQARASCLGRLVAKAVQPDETSLPSFGGCYVVAQSAGAPWFTQDLFSKLEKAQNSVSWTNAAFDEDDDYKAWTWYGYGFLLLLWIALGIFAYFSFRPKP